jgi:DNA-binding response OmpR family regulator
MKLLVILGSDEIYQTISGHINPLGFDCIRYQYPLKAMDNIDEIDPTGVIISAGDFPRHWKIVVQFIRYERDKETCPIIILKGKGFSQAEAAKAFYLGVNGIVAENLNNPAEVDRLQQVLGRYVKTSDKRRNTRYHIQLWMDIGFCAINPLDSHIITGQVKTISTNGLSFHPESSLNLEGLTPNIELAECTLRLGEDSLSPICRLVRTGRDVSLEIIFLSDYEQILLDDYLENLPIQELKAKK